MLGKRNKGSEEKISIQKKIRGFFLVFKRHKNVQGVQSLRLTIALSVSKPARPGNADTASKIKAHTGMLPTVFTPLFSQGDFSESVPWP